MMLLALGILLLGCNPADSESGAVENEDTSTEAVQEQTESGEAEPSENQQTDNINGMIQLFKEAQIDQIAKIVAFPLNRQSPIPSIDDEAAFKERFSEVFDQTLIDQIANSKIEQWSQVGSQGIMLDNGAVWLDDTGEKIIAVNYQSEVEKQMMEDLIATQKDGLHASLSAFERPLYKVQTENYHIRIDQLENGSYRYAAWKIGEPESSKPDLVLSNGILEYQGSGGNHEITFSNGDYSYKVARNVLGADDTPEVTLEVAEKGAVILTEAGNLVAE